MAATGGDGAGGDRSTDVSPPLIGNGAAAAESTDTSWESELIKTTMEAESRAWSWSTLPCGGGGRIAMATIMHQREAPVAVAASRAAGSASSALATAGARGSSAMTPLQAQRCEGH